MYEKLLVAVDHSDIIERVLAAARNLALLASGEVWVLHLREREVMPRPGLIATETSDEAHENVDAAVAELTEAGVKAHGVVRNTVYGYAGREIVDEAKAHDVGAHHHGLARPG
jgi:nucleotide-binding universal stress UspA family protein